MKKILVSMFLLVFSLCLAGCKIEEKTELHFYSREHVNYQIGTILYEIYGEPEKIIDGFYFKKNDIVLNIKYGWNEEKIEWIFTAVDSKQYELICFASYIYLEKNPSDPFCDDYKNFEKSILIEEIDKEVFLSDYYKANYGKGNFFNPALPIFSEENKGIKLEFKEEYIKWIDDSTEKAQKRFYFSVVPIYYDLINNKYLLDFGGKYDGVEITYEYDEGKNLVFVNAGYK